MTSGSIVEYFGPHERNKCGYCHSSDTSYSHGMWGHCLTPQDYQDLINRGWRRSGKYCYKPTLTSTCCPQYTMRCEALKFKLSKSQKKILKRMKHFLIHGRLSKEDSETHSVSSNDGQDQPMECPVMPDLNKEDRAKVKDDVDGFLKQNCSQNTCKTSVVEIEEAGPSSKFNLMQVDSSSQEISASPMKNACKGPDPSKPGCRKAKEIRRERFRQKLLKQGLSPEEVINTKPKQKCSEKTLEDFISEASVENPAHRLELRLIPSNLHHSQFLKTFDQLYNVYQKYQITIHHDPPEKCSKNQYTRFLVTNPFQFSDDDSFDGFYGSYHQQYWLDNKIIAVGVIDILPYCISSVYLYYDPDYAFLSLGTYAALREIAFTRELCKQHPDLKYYYMGFYIHSCPKMKYKGSYSPSYLLCPETYLFKPIEECILKLNQSKYCRFENDAVKEDADGIVYLREVMVLHKRTVMTYISYVNQTKSQDEDLVKEYAHLVGRKCYRRLMLYRS